MIAHSEEKCSFNRNKKCRNCDHKFIFHSTCLPFVAHVLTSKFFGPKRKQWILNAKGYTFCVTIKLLMNRG